MAEEIRERTAMEEALAEARSDKFLREVKKALPGGVLAERFVRVTVTAIQTNPELILADRGTLWRAAIRCAQDGLLPDGREAAFTTFDNKKEGRKDVQYMPMIGGLRKIAANHGISLEAQCVYENDHYEAQFGFDPSIEHKPPRLGEERGKMIGAYAVATDARGQKYAEQMTVAEIAEVRAVSRGASSQYSPWVKWYPEMARKSAARRLWKTLPLPQLDERETSVIDADDAASELPAEPSMTVEEANLSATLAGQIPNEDGPVDALPAAEPEQQSFAEMAEQAKSRRAVTT